MREQVIKAIEEKKIIAIIRGAEPEQAGLAAKAIYDGGIKLVEVTFNQKAPETFLQTVRAIKLIKENCPDMTVGAGTVLTIEQVELAKSAGAEFIVSPDTDEKVIKRTVELDMASCPGAYTATEAKVAHCAGADFVKLFPCTDAGYLKALRAPLSHIKFLAVGGVNVDNVKDFLVSGAVGVGVGGALVNKKLLDNGEYEKITETARRFVENVKE
ncbi:MAG: bifunctional 4-hydroxy-2-oxoglutarate aldolase/2-dehydro-3-deoxy-phosphogluconate aldolase [Clostridia bacterium]|nr:bifunctional 4-hydroxy-2-oxoglutarate aldolase/2-dehydro-3-deoxy-phosphogluconate aldolase [Clostridia bacterium]